jgi:hypothetical protein
MGFLDFIFRKQIKLENNFFGTMLFFEDKKNSLNNYFECRRHFNPTNKIIEIGINGNETGPTKNQIDFFKSIEVNYIAITKEIAPLIENEFQNWVEDFKIDNFQKEFEPIYLGIPLCNEKPIIWEIAFESRHDTNHTFTLTMSDFEAKEILIDG